MNLAPGDPFDKGNDTESGNRSRGKRLLSRVLVTLALLYAIVVLWVFPKWTVDDAYITYRYAENLALHGEFVWNLGEDPVEGYSGVLLPVLLASGIVIGVPPDLTSKIIGVLAFLLGALVLHRTGKLLKFTPYLIGVMLVLYLTLPLSFTHALGGLESMVFGSLLLAALYQLLSVVNDSDNNGGREVTLLMLFLLLVSLARPEGTVFAAATIGVLTVKALIRSRRVPWPLVVRIARWYVFPVAVYFFWRWWYYDSLLPNTYYAKLAFSADAQTITSHLSDFWHKYLALPTAAGALYILGEITSLRTAVRPALSGAGTGLAAITAIVLFLAVVLYQYSQTAAMMDFSFRFFVPFYPFLLIVIGVAANWFARVRVIGTKRLRTASVALIVLALIAIASQTARHVKYLFSEAHTAARYLSLIRDEHVRVGLLLKERVPASEWVVVDHDAGAIPYYSRLKTLDFGALNDRVLARRDLSLQQEIEHFYAHNPGALVFTSRVPDSVVHGEQAAAIISDSRFKQYRMVAGFGSSAMEKYYELVFLRNDLLHHELKEGELQPAGQSPEP